MQAMTEIRPGEVCVEPTGRADATVEFIGRIHTPWQSRHECPRRGDLAGPVCRIEVFAPWDSGLGGIAKHGYLQILYWMHQARRDLAVQSPRHAGTTTGTFALRSPNRPNPVASSVVELVGVEGNVLLVRGLDCIDGTPLIDIKPDHCPHAVPRMAEEAGTAQP